MTKTLRHIECIWNRFAPGFPFEYSFLNQIHELIYRTEVRTQILFRFFSALAILISCLGLLGLAMFMAEQRTKEIGIRKVFGAPIHGIVFTFSLDFIKWVGISNIIAWPLAYLAMNKWLQNFAYHTNISWKPFLISASLALFLAQLTVSYQAFKAARMDPVNTLRYE